MLRLRQVWFRHGRCSSMHVWLLALLLGPMRWGAGAYVGCLCSIEVCWRRTTGLLREGRAGMMLHADGLAALSTLLLARNQCSGLFVLLLVPPEKVKAHECVVAAVFLTPKDLFRTI